MTRTEERPEPEQAEGDYYWSPSGCSPPPPVFTEWYGIPGSGSYLRTRYGTYWVGGGIYQKFAEWGYECGPLGPPVKEYMWLSEFNAWGQWFYGGAVYWRDGAWRVAIVNWGQTAGRDAVGVSGLLARLADAGLVPDQIIDAPLGSEPWERERTAAPPDAEQPPDPPGPPPPLP